MATALRLARPADAVVARRDAFIARVEARCPGRVLTGHRTERLPGIASFVFPGTSGESMLLDLERRGSSAPAVPPARPAATSRRTC